MATVYRIENRDGYGPYRANPSIHDFHKEFGVDVWDRPDPTCDWRLRREWDALPWEHKTNFLFGFKSLAQAKQWIGHGGVARRLDEHAFSIRVITADYVMYGDRQVVFHRDRATWGRQIPIRYLA